MRVIDVTLLTLFSLRHDIISLSFYIIDIDITTLLFSLRWHFITQTLLLRHFHETFFSPIISMWGKISRHFRSFEIIIIAFIFIDADIISMIIIDISLLRCGEILRLQLVAAKDTLHFRAMSTLMPIFCECKISTLRFTPRHSVYYFSAMYDETLLLFIIITPRCHIDDIFISFSLSLSIFI